MANNKKYVENLIGDWETGQYEPVRQAKQAEYNNNWNRLSNEFEYLKQKLNNQMQTARRDYSGVLSSVQDSSFNRMNNANIDLANRGLVGSGIEDIINKADIASKGSSVNDALGKLATSTTGSVYSLSNANNTLGSKQDSLANTLLGNLGNITDAETGNKQNYSGLVADLENSVASRKASGSSSGKTAEEQANDEAYRRMAIADILSDDSLDNITKIRTLINDYDVPESIASKTVRAVGTNKEYESTKNTIDKINARSKYKMTPTPTKKLNKLNKELGKMTYTDIYNLLYNK